LDALLFLASEVFGDSAGDDALPRGFGHTDTILNVDGGFVAGRNWSASHEPTQGHFGEEQP